MGYVTQQLLDHICRSSLLSSEGKHSMFALQFQKASKCSTPKTARAISCRSVKTKSVEAPGMIRAFSMEAFFNIADALEIDPAELIKASMFLDSILKKSSQENR